MPRAPLGPLPPGSYARDLPWAPPVLRDYLRADSWGVTLSGAPWVPGASARHPERILSWFFDRYPADWQARYLDQYAKDGYTHLKLSVGDSLGPVDNGPNSPPGNGQSLDQFVRSCLKVKAVIPYVQVVLGSKYFQPHDMTVAAWEAYADPIMDALITAGAVDEFIPAWEMDLWNVPGATTIGVCKHIGQKAHAAGRSCWLHFSPEKTSWFADKEPRGRYGFYDDLGTDVDGLNYQTGKYPDDDPIVERRGQAWDIADTQARIVDTLHQFGEQGDRHKFRFDEDAASFMWNNDRPNEDDANLRGYLACCTIDNVKHTDAKVWGFGNGARRPDGSII